MAQKFKLPEGKICSVVVAAIVVRQAKPEELNKLKCDLWEVVLPEIVYSDTPE